MTDMAHKADAHHKPEAAVIEAVENEFWLSCGHLLLDRDDSGLLVVTDEFLKLYFARPEIVPPMEACRAERALHARLLAKPRALVTPDDLARLADADARHNWTAVLAFRDHLIAHTSIEAAYLAMMRHGVGQTPPLFITQLVHVLARNVLHGERDPVVLRAGELLFRPQRLTREQGGMLLADEEVADGVREAASADRHASPLIAMLGEHKARELDVLSQANAGDYFKRSDAFDMVLDFRPDGPESKGLGRAALGRVLERWLAHMLGLSAKVTPLARIEDDDWFWFIGLDAEATKIGNALWRGKAVDPGALDRIVALYDLRIEGVPAVAGRPIYLILAMTRDHIVRLKPQNLLVGLPDGVGAGRDG